MRRGIAWLYDELPGLVAQGVLTPEAADALRRHYGPADARSTGVGWGQILLAGFGAMLVGGGIILILAHNWDALGRPARAAVALGVLACAQALTVYALLRRAESVAWREATAAFLIAAVGGSLALVGQTYHLGGSVTTLLAAWLWLILLVPYLTGSCLASIGFWGLLVVRVVALSWRDSSWDPWFLVLGGAPFVVMHVRQRPHSWATALAVMAAAASIGIVGLLVTMNDGWNGLWVVFQLSFLAALIAAASWPPDADVAGTWRGRLLGPSWFALLVIAIGLSLGGVWRSASIAERHFRDVNVMGAAVIAIACAAYASVLAFRLFRAGRTTSAMGAAAAMLAIVAHSLALAGIDAAGWILVNLWLVATGALTLIDGIRSQKLGTANRGLFTLAAFIILRFFDTDLSFLARGLAFVTIGLACFAMNLWLMRRVRRGTS
jgi:hypothetical protein